MYTTLLRCCMDVQDVVVLEATLALMGEDRVLPPVGLREEVAAFCGKTQQLRTAFDRVGVLCDRLAAQPAAAAAQPAQPHAAPPAPPAGKAARKPKKGGGKKGQHEDDEADFQCQICRQEFATRNQLFSHIKASGHAALKR
jgi:hypothetical protein